MDLLGIAWIISFIVVILSEVAIRGAWSHVQSKEMRYHRCDRCSSYWWVYLMMATLIVSIQSFKMFWTFEIVRFDWLNATLIENHTEELMGNTSSLNVTSPLLRDLHIGRLHTPSSEEIRDQLTEDLHIPELLRKFTGLGPLLCMVGLLLNFLLAIGMVRWYFKGLEGQTGCCNDALISHAHNRMLFIVLAPTMFIAMTLAAQDRAWQYSILGRRADMDILMMESWTGEAFALASMFQVMSVQHFAHLMLKIKKDIERTRTGRERHLRVIFLHAFCFISWLYIFLRFMRGFLVNATHVALDVKYVQFLRGVWDTITGVVVSGGAGQRHISLWLGCLKPVNSFCTIGCALNVMWFQCYYMRKAKARLGEGEKLEDKQPDLVALGRRFHCTRMLILVTNLQPMAIELMARFQNRGCLPLGQAGLGQCPLTKMIFGDWHISVVHATLINTCLMSYWAFGVVLVNFWSYGWVERKKFKRRSTGIFDDESYREHLLP